MKLVPINEVFYIEYGNQFDLNKVKTDSDGDIAFISRTSKNNGVSAWVNRFQNTIPYPEGLITVTLGGTYLLSSFVQQYPFYTAQNIKVLKPKIDMSLEEKLFYCAAIQHNRFRYTSHGREANKTFNNILIPHIQEARRAINNIYIPSSPSKDACLGPMHKFDLRKAVSYTTVQELFDVVYGSNLNLSKMKQVAAKNGIPFVSRTSENNGVSAFVAEVSNKSKNPGQTLSVSGGGSVLEVFLQPRPFYSGRDLYYLKPKKSMTPLELLFYAAIIKANKYRYNYGRQANKTLKSIVIPKFEAEYINQFMQSLPYSSNLA